MDDGVVEGDLRFTQSQLLGAFTFCSHILGQVDQLSDNLCRGKRSIGVARQSLIKHLGELAARDQVLPANGADLVPQ